MTLVIQKTFGSVCSSAFSACSQNGPLCLRALAGYENFVTIFKLLFSKYKVSKVAFSFSYR